MGHLEVEGRRAWSDTGGFVNWLPSRRGFFRRMLFGPEFFLFIIVFLCSAFFSEISYQTTNYTARILLTRAIVDHHTFRLDAYGEFPSGDYAFYEGHYYSNKPLGSSLMMIPQYVLLGKPARLILRNIATQRERDVIVGWIVQISSLSLFTAIGFVTLCRIFALLGLKDRRFLLSLLSFFGTLMFPHSTIGYGEMYAVPLLLGGTYFLMKSRSNRGILISGLFFGLASLTVYQTILFAFAAFIFLILTRRGLWALVLFALPVAFSVLLTFLHNWACFGSVLSFPQHYWVHGYPAGLMFEAPTFRKLLEMLFLPNKGIFFYSPFLLLSVPGFWKLSKRRSVPTAVLLSTSFFFLFLYLACNMGWMGGADFGFRYIIPALPFLCMGAAAWISDRRLSIIELILIVVSICICSFGAITDPHVLTRGGITLVNYNIPYFLSHATNNVVNQFLYEVFAIHIWPLRLATTVLFFGLIALLLLSYHSRRKSQMMNHQL